jgi:hypothetical protein
MEWDADEGTISYTIQPADGGAAKPQGVCFKNLKGKTMWPAACFYSSDRQVQIVSCTGQVLQKADTMEPALAAARVALANGASAAEATAAAAAVLAGASASALAAVVPGAAGKAVAAIAAAAVEPAPRPVEPVLDPRDDEAAQMAAHPGIEILVAMGFPWPMARDALAAAGDNVETGA